MKILDTENLEYFYEVEETRQKFALNKIKNYYYIDNFDLIRNLLERPGLDDNIFKLFIDKNNNIFVRFSLVKDFEIISYYISAFNVYKAMYTTAVYYRDKEATKQWRKIMKETYPKYVEDAQKFLEVELRINQDKLINEFNKENIELL